MVTVRDDDVEGVEKGAHAQADDAIAFDAFVSGVQDRVRRALTPVAGADAARQATVDALIHTWRQWPRVRTMDNPAGYVYTVARSRLRAEGDDHDPLPPDVVDTRSEPLFEPRLVPLLRALTERQRTALYLVHGCGWSGPEAAEVLGVSVSTVRNHVERALSILRRELEVNVDDE